MCSEFMVSYGQGAKIKFIMFDRIAIAAPIVAALMTLLAPVASGSEFAVDHDSSLLGFVNHKRGIASALIVDPLTYPSEYDLNIALNPSVESATFTVRYDVKNLQVAGPEVLQRWGRQILEAGATRKPLEAPSRSRRRKIRNIVLSKKFMDAARYPEVRVKSLGIETISNGASDGRHTHKMTIQITMHGKTVTTTFPSTVVLEGDRLTIDAAFPLKLSEFNIKPYSAFFGAVRFSDTFHVYMHFEAKRKPGRPSS